MALIHTLILNAGGIRSLVALGTLMSQEPVTRVALLHVRGGGSASRTQRVRQQVSHYDLRTVVEVEPARVEIKRGERPDPAADPVLPRTRLLASAVAVALQLRAERIVWPVQTGTGFEAVAQMTELLVAIQQVVRLEQGNCPVIQTPMLEWTDQQMMELGVQLGVPWQMAWSCVNATDQPCRVCPGCRRRQAAFASVAQSDPLLGLPAARV